MLPTTPPMRLDTLSDPADAFPDVTVDTIGVGAGQPFLGLLAAIAAQSGGHARSTVNAEDLRQFFVEELIENNPDDAILVIGQYLDQLEKVAADLKLPLITGKTPNAERERFYDAFRRGLERVLEESPPSAAQEQGDGKQGDSAEGDPACGHVSARHRCPSFVEGPAGVVYPWCGPKLRRVGRSGRAPGGTTRLTHYRPPLTPGS